MGAKIFQMLYVAAFTLLVAACATQAQKQAQIITSQLNYTNAEAEKCIAQIKKEDVYLRVNQFAILDLNDPDAVIKMTIDRFATESEKNDLLQLHSLITGCRKQILENLAKVHPDFTALMAKKFAEADENLVYIMKNDMTLGEANEVTNKRLSDLQSEWNSVAKNIAQQLESANQSELLNRQRAAAAMQQWSYQQQLLLQNQQLINSVNRPIMTNCNYIGNSINCLSH